MLEFARRIRFGVDVRHFLELECAFERDRIARAATEKQRVVLVGKALRPFADLAVELERVLDQFRHLCHLPRVQRDRAAIKAAPLRNREAKHRERGELCGEGLGRCDADQTGRAAWREGGWQYV